MTKLEIPNYQRAHNDTSLVIRISGFRRHGVFRHSSIAWGLFIIRHSAVFSVLLFAGAGSVVLAAEGDNAARSLDQQLFEDLDNELLEDLEAESHGSPVSPAPRDLSPENKGAADPLDGDLLDQLGEGEDFNVTRPENPLMDIGDSMRRVERLISQRETGQRTQGLQQQIITELDKLISAACSRCKSAGGSRSQVPQATQRQSVQPPGQRPGQDPTSQGNAPVRDSVERQGRAEAAQLDMDELRDMIEEIWGHLPGRAREQMQNAQVEGFLPEYELLIEEYFKRLAEGED
jgi:hypothetical protein